MDNIKKPFKNFIVHFVSNFSMKFESIAIWINIIKNSIKRINKSNAIANQY